MIKFEKAKVKMIEGGDWCAYFLISNEYAKEIINQIAGIEEGKEYRIEINQIRKKRSLSANGYMWVLLRELSLKLETTDTELYEDFICKYAPLKNDEEGNVIPHLVPTKYKHLQGHFRFIGTKVVQDCTYNTYLELKGTSEMDSAEMSNFLEHIVDECKEQGIETDARWEQYVE